MKLISRLILIFVSMFFPEMLFRSSRPKVFCKKCIFRNFAKFTGKQNISGGCLFFWNVHKYYSHFFIFLLPIILFFFWVFDLFWKYPLRARCSNTEFFLVRIFPYSDWMRENTGQKKLHIWTLFTQWLYCELRFFWSCLSKVKTLFSVSIRLQRNCSNCLEYFSLHKLPDF